MTPAASKNEGGIIMGQHKQNPTAIAAKNGELPPKPKKMSKRESERLIYDKRQEIIFRPFMEAMAKAHEENDPC